MRRRERGIQRKRVKCPDCGYVFTVTYRPSVKRVRARKYRCPECGYMDVLSGFDDPFEPLKP